MPETISCAQIEGIFVGLGVLAVTPRQNGEEPRHSLGAVTDAVLLVPLNRLQYTFLRNKHTEATGLLVSWLGCLGEVRLGTETCDTKASGPAPLFPAHSSPPHLSPPLVSPPTSVQPFLCPLEGS